MQVQSQSVLLILVLKDYSIGYLDIISVILPSL